MAEVRRYVVVESTDADSGDRAEYDHFFEAEDEAKRIKGAVLERVYTYEEEVLVADFTVADPEETEEDDE